MLIDHRGWANKSLFNYSCSFTVASTIRRTISPIPFSKDSSHIRFRPLHTMPPIVHCVRHAQVTNRPFLVLVNVIVKSSANIAQGFHNVPGYDMSKRDPALTPHGKFQCHSLASAFPFHSRINQIFASPLQRTIATAHLSFTPALQNGHCRPEIVALPDAQETSEWPCDTGNDPAVLRQLCEEEGWNVDLSMVHEGWNDKSWDGRYAPTARRIKERARDARRTIREKIAEMQRNGIDSPEVILVTHGGYLHYFTEDWEDCSLFSGESSHSPSTQCRE